MNEALEAEFDTVAEWTAQVAWDLGSEYFLPAACRGSGNPASLRWFIDRLGITGEDRMLDCGAGLGGPAAFARAEVGVAPVLSDPEGGACRGARRLFGLPVVQAGSELPFATGSFDALWSLGVVCTVPDQPRLLGELRRVLSPSGRLGLLVFVARTGRLSRQPSGNTFPSENRLRAMLAGSGLTVMDSASAGDYALAPGDWQDRVDAVQAELARRHRDDPVWQTASSQATLIGRLLSDRELAGIMLVARPS
jgi:SAM-dependent methyltransferase